MAGEIRFNTTLQVVNGQINTKLSKDKRSDQTTAGAWSGVQNIGTSEEVLSLVGVVAARAIQIVNLDATNYVDFGPESTGAMVAIGRLYPGEPATVPLKPGVVIRMQANTAAVDVAYMLVET